MQTEDESPFGTIPPVVGALALAIIGIELVFTLAARGLVGGAGGVGWRLAAIEDYAVFQQVLTLMVERATFPPEHVVRLVTYLFVHAGFGHAAMAAVFVLALGKFVGETLSQTATLACFVLPGIAGALVWWAATEDAVPLYGAFPGAYGLIGAFTFVLYAGLSARGARRAQAFRLIAALIAIQVAFLGLFGGGWGIVADLTGFLTGFVIAPMVAPGGFAAVVERMRRR